MAMKHYWIEIWECESGTWMWSVHCGDGWAKSTGKMVGGGLHKSFGPATHDAVHDLIRYRREEGEPLGE